MERKWLVTTRVLNVTLASVVKGFTRQLLTRYKENIRLVGHGLGFGFFSQKSYFPTQKIALTSYKIIITDILKYKN